MFLLETFCEGFVAFEVPAAGFDKPFNQERFDPGDLSDSSQSPRSLCQIKGKLTLLVGRWIHLKSF